MQSITLNPSILYIIQIGYLCETLKDDINEIVNGCAKAIDYIVFIKTGQYWWRRTMVCFLILYYNTLCYTYISGNLII